MWIIKSHIFLMKSREANAVSSSCYWVDASIDEETSCPYPDKFAVDFSTPFEYSREDYILDSKVGGERDPLYKLRCCLYRYCVDRIDSLVTEELNHTTGKCVFLIKTFLRSVTLYKIAAASLSVEIIAIVVCCRSLYCYWTRRLINMCKRTFLLCLRIVMKASASILSR